jgi:hypothetical protein
MADPRPQELGLADLLVKESLAGFTPEREIIPGTALDLV